MLGFPARPQLRQARTSLYLILYKPKRGEVPPLVFLHKTRCLQMPPPMPPDAATDVFTQNKMPPPMPPGAATCVLHKTRCRQMPPPMPPGAATCFLHKTRCRHPCRQVPPLVFLHKTRCCHPCRQVPPPKAGEDRSVGKERKDPDWECHTRLETD